MLKLSLFFSDCAALGFVLFMGHCGRSLIAHGDHKAAWLSLVLVALWCILYKVARKRV